MLRKRDFMAQTSDLREQMSQKEKETLETADRLKRGIKVTLGKKLETFSGLRGEM